MIPLRLSGTIANRPTAGSAINALYFATDQNIVYRSFGGAWNERESCDCAGVYGRSSGLIANRPSSGSMVGWLFDATDEGIIYEAFPTAWFDTTASGGIPTLDGDNTWIGTNTWGGGGEQIFNTPSTFNESVNFTSDIKLNDVGLSNTVTTTTPTTGQTILAPPKDASSGGYDHLD